MTLKNAQAIVAAMRDDENYREDVRRSAAEGNLTAFLENSGYQVDLHHLVLAMAGCMDELARCSEDGDS